MQIFCGNRKATNLHLYLIRFGMLEVKPFGKENRALSFWLSTKKFLVTHENFIEVSNYLSRELSSSKEKIKEARWNSPELLL